MGRDASGQVIVQERRRGRVFAVRFRAYGDRHYATLGSSVEGWTYEKAEIELANILADVRRGIWRPSAPELAPTTTVEPDFHSFASEWFARRELEGLRPRTLEYLRWSLSDHLLPFFAGHRLSQITAQEVDRYSGMKIAEGRLANSSINKTLSVLASVLELAVEYDHIPTNPARGRRRRLPTSAIPGTFLEPGQVQALLVGAADLDGADCASRRFRRPLLATLAYAGLRVGELLALKWQDVDLAQGRLNVRAAKTDAGVRLVDIQPELREELAIWKSQTSFRGPSDFVFPTGTGKPQNRNNVRRRVVLRAAERANVRLAAEGRPDLLPERLSPHALRRSFASWLIAEGEDVAFVMQQLGHTDPKMTLGLYAKALRSKRRRATMASDADPKQPLVRASAAR